MLGDSRSINGWYFGSFHSIVDHWYEYGTVFKSLESFAVHLYNRNKVPPGVADLSGLTWYCFSKNQLKSQKMPPSPPTSGTPYQKVLRAHYTPQQWKSGHIASPQLPDPEK